MSIPVLQVSQRHLVSIHSWGLACGFVHSPGGGGWGGLDTMTLCEHRYPRERGPHPGDLLWWFLLILLFADNWGGVGLPCS